MSVGVRLPGVTERQLFPLMGRVRCSIVMMATREAVEMDMGECVSVDSL